MGFWDFDGHGALVKPFRRVVICLMTFRDNAGRANHRMPQKIEV